MLVASEQNATSAKRADMRLYWQRALARRSMKGARLCHGASVGVVAKLACLLVPKNCARICRRRTPPRRAGERTAFFSQHPDCGGSSAVPHRELGGQRGAAAGVSQLQRCAFPFCEDHGGLRRELY